MKQFLNTLKTRLVQSFIILTLSFLLIGISFDILFVINDLTGNNANINKLSNIIDNIIN
jgi:hypothetical protein